MDHGHLNVSLLFSFEPQRAPNAAISDCVLLIVCFGWSVQGPILSLIAGAGSSHGVSGLILVCCLRHLLAHKLASVCASLRCCYFH